MRKYFQKLERNRYLLPGLSGHGYDGWLQTETTPLTVALADPQLLSILIGGGVALGKATQGLFKPLTDLVTLLAGDANADSKLRDTDPGYYQIPLTTDDGHRNGPREFVVAVRDAKNLDGSKKYPLDVRTDCLVTKVLFDEAVSPPRATGVEFLDGKYLYRASPLSRNAGTGIKGSANASREVIISGGAYNSPQLLKLSGIGPSGELKKFGIKVIKNLPGVGTNLQDHYEISVQGSVPKDFSALDGCTFSGEEETDACLRKWAHPVLGDQGTYASSGNTGPSP
jgi:choline dehydrogenase